jgi:hypothetical protein
MPLPLVLHWPHPELLPAALLNELKPGQIVQTVEGVKGLWPGVRGSGNRDIDFASASREPWVDANGYLAAYERALRPGHVPLLAHTPAGGTVGVPFDTLELALVEARVHGGNFALSVEPRYRRALLAGDPVAKRAWTSLARTAAWLGTHEAMLGQPAHPAITAVVEPGQATREIANLLHRRGGSPRLVSAANQIQDALVIVAAGLRSPPPEIFAHARAGATVVVDSPVDPAWKATKEEEDRVTYALGRGAVVAYRHRIADPSEFALDVIDLVGYKRRPVRLWNASSAVPLLTASNLLYLVQYGPPVSDMQVRVLGRYKSARLLRPEAAPLTLEVKRRGTMSEVFPATIRRVALVEFSDPAAGNRGGGWPTG